MIKMKALKTFGFAGANEGPVKRGREFAARDARRAQELETHGLAYRVEAPAAAASEDVVAQPHENEAANQGPLDSAGGETGAAEPAPSSPQVPRRGRRRSTLFGDDSTS